MSDIIEDIILKSCLKCGMGKHRSKFKKGYNNFVFEVVENKNTCKECTKTKKSQISNLCEKIDILHEMIELTENEIEILLGRYRSCLREAKRQGADGLLTKAFKNKLFELVGEFCEALEIEHTPPRRIVRGDTITYIGENTGTPTHRALNSRQVKSPEPPLSDPDNSDN